MTVTKTSARVELVLRIAAALGGVVPLDVVYAALPDVQPSAIRRLFGNLVKANVLTRASLTGEHAKIWLDVDGRHKWMRPDEHGFVPLRILPGRTFVHDRMAALLVCGLGHEFGMTFDRELPSIKGKRKPDGLAWIGQHRALVVEIERMQGRNVHVWDDIQRNTGEIKPGLLTGVTEILRGQQKRDGNAPIYESLVCVRHQHLDTFATALASRAQQLGPAQCGWWSVPYENPEADLMWHAVRGDARKNLPGIKTIRERIRPPITSDLSSAPRSPSAPRPELMEEIRAILSGAKTTASAPPTSPPVGHNAP